MSTNENLAFIAMNFKLFHNTVKALLSPRGGLFNFGHSRGGLIREGGLLESGSLIKKLDEEDVYDSCISHLPHILRIQDAIL